MSEPPADDYQHLAENGQQQAQRYRQRFAELRELLDALRRERKQQTAVVAKTRRKLRWRKFSTLYLRALLWVRVQIKREYQLAALLVAFFGSGALSFLIGATFSLSVLMFVGIWIVLAIASFVFFAHVIAFPATETLTVALAKQRQAVEQLQAQLASDESALAETKAKAEPLAREGADVANRLMELSCDLKKIDWRALRGENFEQFLRVVFEHLGYEVRITKATGDQGVDLIVKVGERRIAIQVKGFAQSVDVFAVQEAYAGMAFYHCQACAVITNATFTEAARALAKSVNCILIDGAQIPSLIDGDVNL